MATSRLAMRRQVAQLAVWPRPAVGRSIVNITRARVSRQCSVFQACHHSQSSRPYHSSSTATTSIQNSSVLDQLDTFSRRHIGPSPEDAEAMLKALDPPVASLDEFVAQVLPPDILTKRDLKIYAPMHPNAKKQGASPELAQMSESQLLERLAAIAKTNKVKRCYIGQGYAGTKVPEVIKRNVLESPAWYTSYTPYQPEISQGRLESLLNYQTMISDLTALPMSNASLLDEGTAAAEAMTLSMSALPASRQKSPNKTFVVSHLVHPQTLAVLSGRADGFGIKIEVTDVLAEGGKRIKELGKDLIGVMVQYPNTEGRVEDFRSLADQIHSQGATLSVATDLLALTVLTPPGEFGADIAFGNAQRFGVPFGFGGPHAAFFAVSDKYKRKIPGRLIGVSKDRLGDRALRLALQTREQHIRREKATSNVCTAQALLANMSAFYAVYHGPDGLKQIAERAISFARILEEGLRAKGFATGNMDKGDDSRVLFDTVVVHTKGQAQQVAAHADENDVQVRILDENRISLTMDETVSVEDLDELFKIFGKFASAPSSVSAEGVAKDLGLSAQSDSLVIPETFKRTSKYLTHPVFNTHHSETELLRYIYHLQSKDLSLAHSMIPLGSCTMKLNATTEMVPITWPEFSSIHPYAPAKVSEGYSAMIKELEDDLASITGFDAVSLQPNSGAQGEFTGLRVIRRYQEQQPGKKRDICLIPVSAHGTNPASAAMAGMRVVSIKCDGKTGNLDVEDLKAKCEKYSEELAAIMITYPSTFGIFEPQIKTVCDIVHQYGGQVYMDGANMNAQIGLCSPGEIGADVCHLNLHKTFCIPHGGGGPGVGPIGVKSHLAEFLPGRYDVDASSKAIAPVSSAPHGSASILPISWSYIKMMGGKGLTHATKITLLNANYIMSRLRSHYPIVYTNSNSRCAHEFILDARGFKETAGIEAIDIAKRLQDYGFHAPTMSWPVANTLMIEPTESESKEELDRFIDALISIREEIREVEEGIAPRKVNVLNMAPHTQKDLLLGEWDRPYSREKAAYPLPWLKEKKFWPSVTRLDDTYGDLNLFCTCAPVEAIEE